MTRSSRVAGIDRWREGWIAAIVDHTNAPATHTISLVAASRIGELTESLADADAVAIDMPIALAIEGRREAESLLRAKLGKASRSVFTSPTRAAVHADSQNEATAINRHNGGPGISAQSYGLFASIRELRDVLAGSDFEHWWESHPETSFVMLNDGVPLASKRSAVGVAQRLELLGRHFPSLASVLLGAPPKVPIDDVLDAVAAAWSARRIADGCATVFGPDVRDDQGFALGIKI